MKLLTALASIALASPALAEPDSHHIDLSQYFDSVADEAAQRAAVLADVDRFVAIEPADAQSATGLLQWIEAREALIAKLHRHDIYVYLRAEMDDSDSADRAADVALSGALGQVRTASDTFLGRIGETELEALIAADPRLAQYRYFLIEAAGREQRDQETGGIADQLVLPALDSLAQAYKAIASEARTSMQATEQDPGAAYAERWRPYVASETSLAPLLVSIVQLRDGAARLQGFSGAPESAYARMGLSAAEVDGVLNAIAQTASYRRYWDIMAEAAAARLDRPALSLHPWDVTTTDDYVPPSTPIEEALPAILAAVRPMGPDYSEQFEQLLDPASGRLELCEQPACDHTGFSVGFAGSTSGLFLGDYDGTTDRVRALAHEAGHAVHRQLMNLHQPVGAYNEGPHFVFESFAVFNELLLLDHLYRTAQQPEAKIYYLRQLLDRLVYQVYGSATEVDLERGIYDGVRDGTVRGAVDMDELSLAAFARYYPAAMITPEMKADWARNRLYFIDPLYDVNYLFAALLALEYLRQFEDDPQDFSTRYVALLQNGFDDAPQALMKRFLGIDLDDTDLLVQRACALIDARARELEGLYASRSAPIGGRP